MTGQSASADDASEARIRAPPAVAAESRPVHSYADAIRQTAWVETGTDHDRDGDQDIYVSRRTSVNRSWGAPERVPPPVSSAFFDITIVSGHWPVRELSGRG